MTSKSSDTPSDTAAEQGKVVQDGPNGVAVTFEPGAAVETGHRLIEDGLRAERQREDRQDGGS